MNVLCASDDDCKRSYGDCICDLLCAEIVLMVSVTFSVLRVDDKLTQMINQVLFAVNVHLKSY